MNIAFLFFIITCFGDIYYLYNFSLSLKDIPIIVDPIHQFIIKSKTYAYDFFKFCVPFIQKKSFSTRRDVALTAIMYRERNAPLNLFSIRQSGCQASIVILSNDKMNFSRQTIQMINALEVTVAYSPIPNYLRSSHTDRIRAYFAVNFIKTYRDKYDRIFFFDSFDCFFEHDPFEYFTEEKVYLFQESTVKINTNGCNKNWVVGCYGMEGLNKVGNYYIICSGTIGSGSVDEFIKFYKVLDQENKWDKCKVDQGQLNYITYSGILSAKNVSYHIFGDTGPVQAIALSRKLYFTYFGNPHFTYVKNRLNQTAAVIHQYNRVPKLISGFYFRCNIASFLNFTNANSKQILNSVYNNFISAIN